MRIYANITDRTVRRRFREQQHRQRPLTVPDHTLPSFGFQVTADDARTWFVHVVRQFRAVDVVLGTSANLTVDAARKKAVAEVEADQAERETGPLMRVFAHEFVRRRARCWKPATRRSNLYLLRRDILPCFGGMAVAAITRADVQRWFDSLSGTPGSANIVRNPRKAVARYLDEDELARLGAVLDGHANEHPWPVAALRLLTLTGARLSEVLNLRWDEIGALSAVGGSARIEDSKTGPRTIWLGPEAAKPVASLPRADGAARVFPDDLTTDRLYVFWCGIREEAGLPGLRIHDCRHTYASQGIMNGVGLPTVGRLLGHRRLATTAIYAHLDDATLHTAAEWAAGRIAKAMEFKAGTLPDCATDAQVQPNWTDLL